MSEQEEIEELRKFLRCLYWDFTPLVLERLPEELIKAGYRRPPDAQTEPPIGVVGKKAWNILTAMENKADAQTAKCPECEGYGTVVDEDGLTKVCLRCYRPSSDLSVREVTAYECGKESGRKQVPSVDRLELEIERAVQKYRHDEIYSMTKVRYIAAAIHNLLAKEEHPPQTDY